MLERSVTCAHDPLTQVVEAVGDVPRVLVVGVVWVVCEAVAGDARTGELARGGCAEVGRADEGLRSDISIGGGVGHGDGGRGSGVGGT
jgi:hypothetical protein